MKGLFRFRGIVPRAVYHIGVGLDMERIVVASFLTCIMLGGIAIPSLAADTTAVDVFPLDVGNRWTYRYYKSVWSAGIGDEYYTVDSGRATVDIIDAIRFSDSTRWLIRERRHLYTYSFHFGVYYGQYWHDDSSMYSVTQIHAGRQRLYRQETDGDVWSSVLPWSYQLSDTTAIYRFRPVDTLAICEFRTQPQASWVSHYYHFTFKMGVGQTRVQCRTSPYVVGGVQETNHQLLDAGVTTVSARREAGQPKAFVLAQNYPNPFNPSTTIRYGLPNRSQVLLTVFNTLGQQVAQLVNGEVEAGYHEVKFDGSGRSSGVYFYRLRAADFVQTKKLIMTR
jgi:hypothetical protein